MVRRELAALEAASGVSLEHVQKVEHSNHNLLARLGFGRGMLLEDLEDGDDEEEERAAVGAAGGCGGVPAGAWVPDCRVSGEGHMRA